MDKNGIQSRPKEASWCYKCQRRDTCQDKVNVYMEQMMLSNLRYTKVTAECSGYIQDIRAKENQPESILEAFWRERWK